MGSKQDKERRGSKLLSLLSQGSKDTDIDNLPPPTDESGDIDSQKFHHFPDAQGDEDTVLYDEDGVERDDEYYDEDEDVEEETSSERRRRLKKERKKKKPAVASMNAPRPMQETVERRKRKKPKRRNQDDGGEIELERRKPKSKKKNKDRYSSSEIEARNFLGAHLSAQRKYAQFSQLVQIGRLNRDKICRNSKLLQRIVDKAVASGDSTFVGSSRLSREQTN